MYACPVSPAQGVPAPPCLVYPECSSQTACVSPARRQSLAALLALQLLLGKVLTHLTRQPVGAHPESENSVQLCILCITDRHISICDRCPTTEPATTSMISAQLGTSRGCQAIEDLCVLYMRLSSAPLSLLSHWSDGIAICCNLGRDRMILVLVIRIIDVMTIWRQLGQAPTALATLNLRQSEPSLLNDCRPK